MGEGPGAVVAPTYPHSSLPRAVASILAQQNNNPARNVRLILRAVKSKMTACFGDRGSMPMDDSSLFNTDYADMAAGAAALEQIAAAKQGEKP